jgi:hypothetical protein
LNFRFEFLKHSCDPPFVKVEIIKEILICMTYLQVWLKHLVSTTIKPGNKRPVTVIDRHKHVICSVLTGTHLIVSVTLSGAHFSGL